MITKYLNCWVMLKLHTELESMLHQKAEVLYQSAAVPYVLRVD